MIGFIIKLDNCPAIEVVNSFIYGAFSIIIKCCKNGNLEEVDQLLNHVTNEIVTKGVDVKRLVYLSKVEKSQKDNQNKKSRLEESKKETINPLAVSLSFPKSKIPVVLLEFRKS